MASQLQGKNILVTGGTGFVGSHVIEELLSLHAHVYTTFLEYEPTSYFSTSPMCAGVTQIQVDINDFDTLFDIVTKFEIDYIFHLAAQALVDVAYVNPRRTLSSNIMGTVHILECARLFPRIKGVIVASSDKAYGKLTKNKYVEHDALRGDHPYEVSKSAADLICYAYFKTYGVPVTVSRFGNIYGEGDLNFSRIFPGIIASAIKQQTLQLRSNGKAVRDYLYVKDVVRGYILLAEKIEKTKGEAFNFGSSDTHSVLDLIQITESALHIKIPYKVLNQAKNEIPYQSLQYKKATQVLGWKPSYTIEDTIEHIFNWYKQSPCTQ